MTVAAHQDHQPQPDRGVDWSVPCQDAFGRRRALGVIRKPGCIVLVAPPGETAILDYHAAEALTVRLAQEVGHLRPVEPLGP